MSSGSSTSEQAGATPKCAHNFRATWNAALLLIGVVAALRLVYLIWLSPYQLIGDESYYWEQARHLDLCYDEKGPLLAWFIALCCRAFGNHEWVVRLPMLIGFIAAAWGVGRMALALRPRDERVAFLAVVCYCLIPAFQANAQICTQDGLLIPVWLALSGISMRLFRRWHDDQNTWPDWMLFWVTLGIGVLLKQSVLLFVPSLLLYIVIQRRELRWRAALIAQQLVGAVLFALVISPMIIWNSRHGWPMLSHTLGHLGAGGDQTGAIHSGNAITWSASLLGGVIAAMGPAFVVLAVWAGVRAFKQRLSDPAQWRNRLWLMLAAWPSMLFFLALSMTKPVIASWPLPAFAPLVVFVAEFAASELAHYGELITTWRENQAAPKPDTPAHRAWWVLTVWGVVGWLILSFPSPLGAMPVLGPRLTRSVLDRFSGHREAADDLRTTLADLRRIHRRPPLIVTRHYMHAGLYCFYLRRHPTVYTAGKYLGKRPTTFDEWPDTRLDNPRLYGRSLLLDGQGDVPWDKALKFDSIRPVHGGRYFLARNYQGPRADHPRLYSGED